MGQISERTLLPLGLVAILLSTVIGFVMWLTNMHSNVIKSAEAIQKIEIKQDEYSGAMEAVRLDIGIIKAGQVSSQEMMQGLGKQMNDLSDRFGIYLRRQAEREEF